MRKASPGLAAMTSLDIPIGYVNGAVKLACRRKSTRLLQPISKSMYTPPYLCKMNNLIASTR